MLAKTRSPMLALLSVLAGCNLLGRDDAPPPVVDPSLHPPAETQPAPTPAPDPTPGPAPQGSTTPTTGISFPGLEGLPIPLPLPDPNAPDPAPPARGSLAAAPAGSFDGNGHLTRAFLAPRAQTIHQALVAALDTHQSEQTRAIPFEVLDEPNEPNAAAACTRATRTPVMMITSAMLELAAGISETSAYDEAAGTTTYETYVTSVIEQVRNQRPVQGVDPSLHTAPHSIDPHKLARQVHLYDQQIAFIVGHELAHHYRGHTDCVSGRTDAERERGAISRRLAHTIPTFSQPREVEADMWGVVNVMESGRGRTGGVWNQEGALLNMDFFRRLADQGGAELVLAFLSTHPPALVRIPIVRSTAQQWQPGWRPPAMPTLGPGGIELPGPGGTIRLPDPSQLGIDPSQLPFPFPPRQR